MSAATTQKQFLFTAVTPAGVFSALSGKSPPGLERRPPDLARSPRGIHRAPSALGARQHLTFSKTNSFSGASSSPIPTKHS